ncbi:hemin-degrading factor [Luteimonas sp. BDR2-5]|uniref:hemin-degrading factor n=1 Tax=Proluteimonas luteida TaxID=2878685 RepID=UPI001E6193C5|nr:hemin-degrading factor [Luteimonas sp. BDR2-5]MCD9029832.1 hemin-degrading factor [Luteimonas sp. BDR2-5]
MTAKNLILTLSLLAATGMAGHASAAGTCASPDDARVIQNYYANTRPGAPPPAVGRLFRMPEATVVSALHADHAYGVRSNRLFFDEVWKSVDAWGADTRIGIVFTSGGMHAWNFPSTVPQTQSTTTPIWYDMYADEGAGVHGHITPQEVDQIWALQIPTVEADKFTRILAFYDKQGALIVGLYVSENTKAFDQRAVDGFERTRELLRTQPRICGAD